MRRFLRFTPLLIIIVSFSLSLLPNTAAAAGCTTDGGAHIWCNRGEFTGYFTGAGADCAYSRGPSCTLPDENNYGNDILPASPKANAVPSTVNSVATLIKFLKTDNGSTDPRIHFGAAFIAQTLLGRDADEANARGGRNISEADWTDLTNRMNSPAVSINWNVHEIVPYRTYMAWAGGAPDPVTYASADDPQSDPAIVFTFAGGKYVLFRPCANPGGNSVGLPPAAPPGLTGYKIESVSATSGGPHDDVSYTGTYGTSNYTAHFNPNNTTFGFSDDWIKALRKDATGQFIFEHSADANSFHFSGSTQLRAGDYEFTSSEVPAINQQADTGWRYLGYSICVLGQVNASNHTCDGTTINYTAPGYFFHAAADDVILNNGTNYTIRFIYQKIPVPNVGGYIIDDSGQGDATITGKPFANDTVKATPSTGGATSVTGEPFRFNGTNNLEEGSYTFTGIDTPPPDDSTDSNSWAFEGYTICDTADTGPGQCNQTGGNQAAWLDDSAHIMTGAVSLIGGHTYNVRMIYTQVTCSVSADHTPVQPGDPLSLTYDVTHSAPLLPSPTLYISYPANSQGNSLGSTETVTPYTAASSPNTLEYVKTGLTAQQAGTYHVSIQLKSSAVNKGIPCNTGFSVVTLPYFKVQNSGISASGSFDTGNHMCASGSSGLIAGWNDDTASGGPPQDRGASSDYYALADQPTYGFASAYRSGTGLPAFLSIANTTVSTPANYTPQLGGGNATGNTPLSLNHCLTTQAEKSTKIVKSNVMTIDLADSTLPSGDYQIDAPIGAGVTLTIKTSGQVPSGKHISIFVHGNVYIDGNIAYDGTATWATHDDIPSVVVVADGSIVIDPNVTQLDGLYEATNTDFVAGGTYSAAASSTTGKEAGEIYTCGLSSGAYKTTDDIYNLCKKQLVVNGSFVANQLNLLRTYGSLHDATNGERYTGSGSTACTNDGSGTSSSCAAEVFNFSPEFFLSDPMTGLPNNGIKPYDSITSLPPIL